MQLDKIRDMSMKIYQNVAKVIVGKKDVAEHVLIALIASGHVLLEDVPGLGKTMLAKAVARSIGADFKRTQFTPDLLPSDLTGINFYDPKSGEFKFRAGSVFTNILLADEINRATPRTQSSLLECMEERQVSVDGQTMKLDAPFIVIATQNPIEIQGTFPLPEAQLDRFMLKTGMGYPTAEDGVTILERFNGNNPLETIQPVATAEEVADAQRSFTDVEVSADIYRYIVDIAEASRKNQEVLFGISPRGTQALLKASQVRAILSGRDFVTPDDVKRMLVPVLSHRLILKNASRLKTNRTESVLEDITKQVPVPAEDAAIKA